MCCLKSYHVFHHVGDGCVSSRENYHILSWERKARWVSIEQLLVVQGGYAPALFLVNFLVYLCMKAALNIVKLGPGLAEVKGVDHNAFIIITSKKEYRCDKIKSVHFSYPR